MHDAAEASVHLRRAIGTADRHGLAVAGAEARMSYALILDDLGRPRLALREIDRACTALSGLRRARAMMQRALILRRLGRDAEALSGYRAAVSAFRRRDDPLWLGRALVNRAVLYGYRGELRLAGTDLREALALFTRLRMPAAVAQVQHNLGFLAAQAGDVPAALQWYDRAHGYLRRTGTSAIGLIDRAELLLSARLLPEARATVAEAVEAAGHGAMRSLLGQARLLSARVELVSAELTGAANGGTENGSGADGSGAADEAALRALSAATLAARTLRRQGRTALAALARRTAAAARIAGGHTDLRTLRALESSAGELAAAGRLPQAWDAWIDAARLALALGDRDRARRSLAAADGAPRSGPAALRARAWHARALLELAGGRTGAAKRCAAAGYREVEAHRASLGATELGLRSTADGVELAALRLRLALEEGDAPEALRWLQRSRAAALRLPPARPSGDPAITRHLAELRHIGSELQGAADPQRVRRLLRRQRAVEEEVRRRAWQVPARDPGAVPRQPSLGQLRATLDGAALVELFALDRTLHALVVTDRAIRHRPLCTVGEAAGELDALRFAVRRTVLRQGPARSRAAAADSVGYGRDRLERLLLAPVADLVGDRPLVLAPTGALHGLPWPMLPSCRGRPVSVTPSSWLWWRAAQHAAGHPAPAGGTVLVAGQAPPEAAAEVAAIAGQLPEATVLTGTRASVAAVLPAIDGAARAHLATHGAFRSDNPLFSHLRLADGPLTVYDLSGLRRAPALVILSACDSGLSAVHPGDELQGLSAAMLGLGTRAVVASLGPVRDEATRALMVDLHRHLSHGSAPARALAAAQAALDPELDTTGGSFVCLGAG